MSQRITKDIVVFYHGMCRDGFTAAWSAWKKFGDTADYVPVIWTNQSEQIPEITDKEVYFLDYCPLKEKVNEIASKNKSVTVVDHHVSREEVVKSLPGSVYDVAHSGAVLAWKYFHPNTEIPQICLYVEDSDLWKWSIPGSAEVLATVDLKRKFNFETWETLAVDLEDPALRKEYQEKGEVIVLFSHRVVDRIIEEQGQLVNFEGYEVYAVNGPRYFKSEIGNELRKRKPPFGIIWNYTPDEISISLRSEKDFDLIPLASKYGGGGHKNASNFRLPLGTPLPWKRIDKNHEK